MVRDADIKWIYIGSIIPDFPWIVQRATRTAFPGIDPYDLRVYCVVQASLLFCTVLSCALASFSSRFWKTFAILAFGSFLHLFLDAAQTKWGNGVHFFAPLDWRLINFELFWPESLPTYLLTSFGLFYFMISLRRYGLAKFQLAWPPHHQLWKGMVLIVVYLAFPVVFFDGAVNNDSHYVKTLSSSTTRSGHYIAIDRGVYHPSPAGGHIRTYADEDIRLKGVKLDTRASLSIRGEFIDQSSIHIHECHVHSTFFRDVSSSVGLLLVFLYFFAPMVRSAFKSLKTKLGS